MNAALRARLPLDRPSCARRRLSAVALLLAAPLALAQSAPRAPAGDAPAPPSIADRPAAAGTGGGAGGAPARRVLTPGVPAAPAADGPTQAVPAPSPMEQYRPRFGPATSAAPGASAGVGLPAGPGDASLPGSEPGVRRR